MKYGILFEAARYKIGPAYFSKEISLRTQMPKFMCIITRRFLNCADMKDRMFDLIKKYELQDCVRWLLENKGWSASGRGCEWPPYHGFVHSLRVLWNACECYTGEFDSDIPNVPRELLLAALFHDAWHSGGKLSDQCNVDEACKCLVHFQAYAIKRYPEWFYIYPASKMLKRIYPLIQSTKYPHEPMPFIGEEMERQMKCLRDADLMAVCEDTLHNLPAIKAESFKDMDWKKYLEQSMEFMDGIAFYTDFGRDVGDSLRQSALKQVEEFYNLLFMENKND